MPHEIVLFWLVAAGFLVADNLVLLPSGCDYLRFGASGRFVYDASSRLEARGRELVVLNPLNLLDRAAVTTQSLGTVDRRAYSAERRRVIRALPTMNLLSWVGYAYMLCAGLLAGLSFAWHFSAVLASFLAVHLLFWAFMSVLLVRRRLLLGLDVHQMLVLAVEALFVPAYTMNLGKRVWARQRLALPAMTLGIRQARRIRQQPLRELMVHQLLERLDLLEACLPDGEAWVPAGVGGAAAGEGVKRSSSASLGALICEARACLLCRGPESGSD